jgi:hypothetical protein
MLSAQAPERGRGGQAQGPPTNLQVLPKDMPREQVGDLMRNWSAQLGVQCVYCHVQEGPNGRNDRALDDKQTKKTARVMFTMMKNVNDTLTAGVGKQAADVTKVECGTCHRGQAMPKYEAPPALPAGGGGGGRGQGEGQRPPA